MNSYHIVTKHSPAPDQSMESRVKEFKLQRVYLRRNSNLEISAAAGPGAQAATRACRRKDALVTGSS
jgi:hypothetical protein